MPMTVRELIEHLAMHDQNMVVKLRDPLYPTVLIDIAPHAVVEDEFCKRDPADSAAVLRQKILSGEVTIETVVVIG